MTKQANTFQCPTCKVKYSEEKWARECQKWCSTHNGSCSLEIIKHAIK